MVGSRRPAAGSIPPGEGQLCSALRSEAGLRRAGGEGDARRLPTTRLRPCGATPRQAAYRQQGSALILALVLVFVLIMVALAFIITARTESRAATNSLRGLQAEAACRAGLAAALYRIEQSWNVYSNLADTNQWHAAFYDAAGPDLCPAAWVEHYDAAPLTGRMTAKRWPLPLVVAGDPSPAEVKALKRQRGFTAEYYVAVADLDGKLHGNPLYYDNLLGNPERLIMIEALGISVPAATKLADDNTVNWALGDLRVKLIGTAGVPAAEYNAGEKFFTVYPPVATLDKATMKRPAVNVNTARREVLKAIVRNVSGFDDAKADAVAGKLVAKRPFANRKEMEKALVELGQSASGSPPWTKFPDASYKATDNVLAEQQTNDLLNSLAGNNSAAIDASDLDRSSTAGLYSYDFDGSDTTNTPPVGDYTALASDAETVAATWGTEVKFTSQFYHLYVLGRTIAADDPKRVMSERRAHAIYDAGARKIVWFRWNFAAKANMGD